jgi:hypothetical protein
VGGGVRFGGGLPERAAPTNMNIYIYIYICGSSCLTIGKHTEKEQKVGTPSDLFYVTAGKG